MSNGWRTIVVDNHTKLGLMQGYMTVRQGNEQRKVIIEEIYALIIESTAVSLTAALLAALIKAKVKVIFCDESHVPHSELVSYYGAHDSSRKFRTQIKWDRHAKEVVWTAIIQEKIRKQSQLLKRLGKEQHKQLEAYQETVHHADATNREGQAAKVYFAALFGLDFSRNSDCAINAALNYGYSILMAAFSREITACGYSTQLGIGHDSVFNHFNLVSDLMEPYRPLVDALVYEMKPEVFGKDEKRVILSMLDQTVLLNDKKQIVKNAIRLYCQSVFDAIEENDALLIRFYENEL